MLLVVMDQLDLPNLLHLLKCIASSLRFITSVLRAEMRRIMLNSEEKSTSSTHRWGQYIHSLNVPELCPQPGPVIMLATDDRLR